MKKFTAVLIVLIFAAVASAGPRLHRQAKLADLEQVKANHARLPLVRDLHQQRADRHYDAVARIQARRCPAPAKAAPKK